MNQDETTNHEESMAAEPEVQQPDPPEAVTADTNGGIERRDLLKGLAGIPVVGWLFWRAFKKKGMDGRRRQQIMDELGELPGAPAIIPASRHAAGEKIRLGVIGYGGEGHWLTWCAGFVPAGYIDTWKNENPQGLEDFMAQTDLNVEITAVCDLFDKRAETCMDAATNTYRPGGENTQYGTKRYRDYRDMLRSGDVDAVLIATPDHWHARMAMDAAAEGIHVYLEKAMTRVEQEAIDLRRAVNSSGIVFQLGHQNRQLESHEKARQIVDKGILGPITLIETTTNRNSPGGAWVYDIDPDGTPDTIDWDLFQEAAPSRVPFSPERFFRWRCWFDYGTGLSGDLFSHEYDAVNQILNVGIPETVTASGGVYFYDNDRFFDTYSRADFPVTEKRDVPDVFHVSCEYPERNLTLLYSATLANSRERGKLFMGHDGTMDVMANLTVYADSASTHFREKLDNQIIDPSLPLFTWQQGSDRIDAVTSASDRYFLSRGLMYTYRGGQKLPTNHLHISEWLDVIRNGGTTSCNIDRGFEEAMICHMATKSYLEKRQVRWDPVRQRIV